MDPSTSKYNSSDILFIYDNVMTMLSSIVQFVYIVMTFLTNYKGYEGFQQIRKHALQNQLMYNSEQKTQMWNLSDHSTFKNQNGLSGTTGEKCACLMYLELWKFQLRSACFSIPLHGRNKFPNKFVPLYVQFYSKNKMYLEILLTPTSPGSCFVIQLRNNSPNNLLWYVQFRYTQTFY